MIKTVTIEIKGQEIVLTYEEFLELADAVIALMFNTIKAE